MSAAAPELPSLVGRQEPVIRSVSPYVSTSGPEAVALAHKAGLVLDPWQQYALRDALGERTDGRWSAFEVALIVARQNGKGGFFEARVLAGLFLLDERLIMYSAHEFKTAQEMFRRIEALIDGTAMMRKRVKAVSRSKGDEGIELTTGQRVRFLARSKNSGRGFSGDCNILDECQNLADDSVDALMPTMSARPNPQLLYGGSAPDKDIAPCDHIARVRRRALAGGDPSLAYLEWSADLCDDTCPADCSDHDDPDDPLVWAKTNPALGIRITVEHVARERESMGAKGFARERLSVGNWPVEEADHWSVIPEDVWLALADAESQAVGPIAYGVDGAPGGTHTAIGVAGTREDGLGHSEVIDHRRGTGWVLERAQRLDERWNPVGWVIDPRGPVGFLAKKFEDAGLNVIRTSAADVAHSTDSLIAATGAQDGDEPTFRYVPKAVLDTAVAGADTSPLGDGRKWNRKTPLVDISPLVAITLARLGLATYEEEESMVPLGAVR